MVSAAYTFSPTCRPMSMSFNRNPDFGKPCFMVPPFLPRHPAGQAGPPRGRPGYRFSSFGRVPPMRTSGPSMSPGAEGIDQDEPYVIMLEPAAVPVEYVMDHAAHAFQRIPGEDLRQARNERLLAGRT